MKGNKKTLKNCTFKLEAHKHWKILNMQSLTKMLGSAIFNKGLFDLLSSQIGKYINHYFSTEEFQPQLKKCWEILHYENMD